MNAYCITLCTQPVIAISVVEMVSAVMSELELAYSVFPSVLFMIERFIQNEEVFGFKFGTIFSVLCGQ